MKIAVKQQINFSFVRASHSFLVVLFLLTYLQITAQPLPSQLDLTQTGPDSFLVVFNTTKGEFTMKAHRSWSPLACDRLYLLAKKGYYNNNVIYRVAPTKSFEGGFVVQFGIGNSFDVNEAWDKYPIPDEPVVYHHQRGSVNFARGGPNSRTVQLAITLTPCLELDTVNYEGVVGFPTIAVVTEGMKVIESFNRKYGNAVFDSGDSLQLGRDYFDRVYPGLDRIISVVISKEWNKKLQGKPRK